MSDKTNEDGAQQALAKQCERLQKDLRAQCRIFDVLIAAGYLTKGRVEQARSIVEGFES